MRRLLAVVLSLTACGGGGDDDEGGGGADGGGGGNPACETSAGTMPASGAVKIGGVETIEGVRASVEGLLVTGTDWQFFNMAPQRQIESARAGDCVLYEWEPSFCDPECTDGICHDGTCKSYPELISAGTLRVVADDALIQVEADAPTFWGPIYRSEILAVPAAGAQVAFCAGGDTAGGFGAILEAVPPLLGALPDDGVLELADTDARVRLTLNADNQNHGLPYRAIIECDSEDTGSLVVPQELVEAFPSVPRPPENFACAGTDCPRSQLVRYRAHEIDESDLRLEVRVESAVQFWLEH